jgi:phosphoribosylamine---glycine ligase
VKKDVVLVVGQGAREHALARRLAIGDGDAPRTDREVLVCPGNAGIAREHKCVEPHGPGVDGIVETARDLRASLVVVGPEQPLVDGLVDLLERGGVAAFGPRAAAARLEGSKAFMKDVCRKAGVPTADFAVCATLEQAERFVASRAGGVVVKADGLCAGKGVTVCPDKEQALDVVREYLGGGDKPPRFGAASRVVVVEDLLPGLELSVLAICDGERPLFLAPARDHKRLLDDDRGPNTGGMGAIAPLGPQDGVTPAFLAQVERDVFVPVLAELRRRGAPFRGVLYAGLMLRPGGFDVLEFNVRLGDPEAECILHGTNVDLLPLMKAIARGGRIPVDAPDLVGACRPSAVVVAAARGYPEKPETGHVVEGLDAAAEIEGAHVYCAGVRAQHGKLVTAGGRVLACTAQGADLAEALVRAYALVDRVRFEGLHARRDVGRTVIASADARIA